MPIEFLLHFVCLSQFSDLTPFHNHSLIFITDFSTWTAANTFIKPNNFRKDMLYSLRWSRITFCHIYYRIKFFINFKTFLIIFFNNHCIMEIC